MKVDTPWRYQGLPPPKTPAAIRLTKLAEEVNAKRRKLDESKIVMNEEEYNLPHSRPARSLEHEHFYKLNGYYPDEPSPDNPMIRPWKNDDLHSIGSSKRKMTTDFSSSKKPRVDEMEEEAYQDFYDKHGRYPDEPEPDTK